MRFSSLFLTTAFLLAVSPSWADPPMKVIYSQTVSTNFKWKWPLQTTRTYSAVQTKPYYYTGRILYLDQNIDVSKYRFNYSYRANHNEWGYFFQPGTILTNKRPYPIFPAPQLYYQGIQIK